MVGTASGYLVAVIGVVFFLSLTIANYLVGRRWLYPAAIISALWTVVFIVLCVASTWLYPVPPLALAVFVVGVGYYSIGSYMALKLDRKPDHKPAATTVYRSDFWLLVVILAGLIIGFPFYLHQLENLVTAMPFTPVFFLQLREALLEQGWTQNRYPIIYNLVDLSNIAAIIAMLVTDSGRRWKWLLAALVGIAFIYNLTTAAKIGFASLAVELLVIYGIQRKKIPIRALAIAGATFVVGFGVIVVERTLADQGGSLGLIQRFALTGRTLLDYLTVSVVGFGVYLQHPEQIPAISSIWLPFERTINYFGNYIAIPRQQGAFVSVGPNMQFNTFTALFTYYPEYGVPGVAVILFAVGFVTTRAYKAASRGSFFGALLFAYLYFGTCMTFYNESIFISLNFLAKLLVVGVVFIFARRFCEGRMGFAPIAAQEMRR